jgi:thiol:disulfide interchange protein DsbG
VVLYATPDGGHVLVGTLLDAEGRNLSQQHLAKHLPEPDRNQDWARLADAEWIATGAEDPERVVYMFTDPYCPYCNAIWRASQPYYDDGLQIRHILVGVIRPQSGDKAAAILQADDPAAAFRSHQESYDRSNNAQVPDRVSDQARAAVQSNNQLMRELGIGGTPAVYYKTAEGKVKLANGMPKLSRLADMYRLPEQSVDDPSLDRFR